MAGIFGLIFVNQTKPEFFAGLIPGVNTADVSSGVDALALYKPTGTFNPPGNVRVTIEGTKTIILTWDDNSTTESGYRISRREGAAGPFMSFSANAGVDTWFNATTTKDYSAEAGKTYQYLVQTERYGAYLNADIVTITIP